VTILAGLEFPDWVDVAARNHPDKLALSFAGDRWTFADLRRSVAATAEDLKRARGDSDGRIGILSANRPGFVFAVHAATRLAAPVVPLNWRQTADEIAWQLRDADITMLLVDEERLAVAVSVCAIQPVTIVPIDDLERTRSQPGEFNDAPRIDLGREAAIIYTSGTCGRPKGARISYGNLWFSVVSSALHLGHHPGDAWLAAMPLFHIGGLSILFRGVIGVTSVVLHERFDPERALIAIDDGVTLASVVPVMLQRMLDSRGDAPWAPHLRCMLLGGSSAPPRLIDDCLRLGIPVAATYGLTEATSQVTTMLPGITSQRPSSSGLPVPLTEVRVTAPSGKVVVGEIGLIEMRGPTLFAGYLDDGDAGPRVTADGWFQTGDAGYLDRDGYLYVVDRRDDLINTGGENVYPSEVERVLQEHPFVADAGVIGAADETWGSRPVAAVVWRGDPDTASNDLLRHCGERLASYKVPDRVVLVAELPRSPSGKLLRRALHDAIASVPESKAR
jgi:O-succinylbenzoic acid--CoA ligase